MLFASDLCDAADDRDLSLVSFGVRGRAEQAVFFSKARWRTDVGP